jgi:hypothetical protein
MASLDARNCLFWGQDSFFEKSAHIRLLLSFNNQALPTFPDPVLCFLKRFILCVPLRPVPDSPTR